MKQSLNSPINLRHASSIFLAASIVRCIVERAGRIASRAKVNLAEVPVDLPALPLKDRQDLVLAAKERVDLVIVSNAKQAETLKLVREILTGRSIMLV